MTHLRQEKEGSLSLLYMPMLPLQRGEERELLCWKWDRDWKKGQDRKLGETMPGTDSGQLKAFSSNHYH